ncbi:putative O-methyltransferase [Metarhizium acridum CQMa 102]|uniref:Putative O-methyltransferase n=1 Tax=Metarhizium acridum (strain CQMa 102) TaxID=655827 RepID=E9E7L0_METAQ|nr:putative O-methyltransferase [Metarhizium acridum CQMa 102]EFY88120.1 putative O-methyltransferase [Metarhizium acridum CQMa 102]
MIENCTTLYPNDIVGRKVSEYSDQHSVPLPEDLVKYHEWVMRSQENSYFTISLLEARMLSWMARMVNAKRVLEIGTFVGFSVATWANAVGKDGSVTGLEKTPEFAQMARDQLSRFGWNNAQVVTGDALHTLAGLEPPEPYDIIFIDAQKSGYPAYLKIILDRSQPGQANRLLRPGGLIIGDNALRCGLVADESDDNPATKTVPRHTINWDWSSIAFLDEFNKMMHDPVLYERLIKRHQTSSERQQEGQAKGYGRVLEADLARGETRLSALATEAAGEQREDLSPAKHRWHAASDIDNPWDGEASTKEQGFELWKEFLRERFIRGGDEDFDYARVDGNEELDVVLRRDEEDRWFDDEEPSWAGDGGAAGETGVQDF